MSDKPIEVFRPKPWDSMFGEVIVNERVIYSGRGTDEELLELAKEALHEKSE